MKRSSLIALPAACFAAAVLFQGACSDPCCLIDGNPVTLISPGGMTSQGLRALWSDDRSVPHPTSATYPTLAIDTGAALTLFARRADERAQMVLRSFDVLDATPNSAGNFPTRAQFQNIEGLPVPLPPQGPSLILGGTFLTNFSVSIDFVRPALTLWARQGATDGVLNQAGFAVLHFDLLGGAELSAQSRPDFLGLTGPVEVPPTRVILRACGGSKPLDVDAAEPELCCKRGDELVNASGVNLALSVNTGIGPLVLSESAWNRFVASQDVAPLAPVAGDDLVIPGLLAPIKGVQWAEISRLAIVDTETDAANNPGACVELRRARRLMWVENHRDQAACAQLCDTDPRNNRLSQNAASFLEISRTIPVAIIPDATDYLQALRAEVRPEGPEVDGLLGADVLGETSVELDFRSHPSRSIWSCAPGSASSCTASPRCLRLENAGNEHACFGLSSRALPAKCAASGCGVP